MNSMRNVIYLGFLILFASCGGIQKSIIGFWTIDKIEYKEQDLLFDVLSNVIIFNSKECTIPRVDKNNPLKAQSNEGTWTVIKNSDGTNSIKIVTENEIFSGTHQICFKKDFQNKLVKMIISSQNLYIECRKALTNFDAENNNITEYLCE